MLEKVLLTILVAAGMVWFVVSVVKTVVINLANGIKGLWEVVTNV